MTKIVRIDEPKVAKVVAPKREEICRVGIVLEEDNKTQMSMTLSLGGYQIFGGENKKTILTSDKKNLTIKTDGTKVYCLDENGGEILSDNISVGLKLVGGKEEVAPGSGILLRGVVAGRGFHWQKEVDLTFPYSIEFHHKNSKLIAVNEIPIESYLACVVTSEMSAACPPEFIKAQATAARTWMIVFLQEKHKGLPYSICNDDCCQRYQGTTHLKGNIAEIVDGSRGVYIVTNEGYLCASYYSKSCGGIIEKAENIFGEEAAGFSESTDAPCGSPTEKFSPITEENMREWVEGKWLKDMDAFCSPAVCPEETLNKYLGAVDDKGKYFRWETVYSQEELIAILKKKAQLSDIAELIDFKVRMRGNSGRIHNLDVIYKTVSGEIKTLEIESQYEIRYALHDKFLFSSGFVWDFEKDASGKIKTIKLHGAGWGHGAGFCQIGALGMALKGYKYEEILKHYFDKTSLVKAY